MPEALERFLLLYRLHRLMARTVQAAADLTLLEAACLALADQSDGGVTLAQAEAALRVPRERLTPAIDSLAAREHLVWERSRTDRRTFAFRSTTRGTDAAAFTDEAVAIGFINTCRFLTEEGFDQVVALLQRCFDGKGTERLMPAAALGALDGWGAALAVAAAQRGAASVSVALLALLARAEGPTNVGDLGAAVGLSPWAVGLHGESLVEKGLAAWVDGRDRLSPSERGSERLRSVLAHGEWARMRQALGARWAADDAAAEAFDDLMSLLGYVFEGEGEAPRERVRGGVGASRPAALSALYALLGSLFSYHDRSQAVRRTDSALLEQVRGLLAALGVGDELPVDVATRFEAWAAKDGGLRARTVREEFTRLFYGYPCLVPTTGSHWVQRGRTEFSLARGERAAVGLEYRKLGLKNRPGHGEPFDALVSELDFLSYVTSLEARAFEAGDAASAREWEALRHDFCTHHFRELGRGVADAIVRHSNNPALALYAWLLGRVSEITA